LTYPTDFCFTTRHYQKLNEVFDRHKNAPTKALISKLNPIITGWCNYYQWVCSKYTFSKIDHLVWIRLWRWCTRRHPNKSSQWIKAKYFPNITFVKEGKIYNRNWQLNDGESILNRHADTEVKHEKKVKVKVKVKVKGKIEKDKLPKQGRFVKVQGTRSPFDGDWKYWGGRGTQLPGIPKQLAILLKQQKGKCNHCGLNFIGDDIIEIDHITPKTLGGSNDLKNKQALHGHCHDIKTRTDGSHHKKSSSTHTKGQSREERDEVKVSRPVLKTSRSGDASA